MNLSTKEAAGYAAAYLRLALKVTPEEMRDVDVTLCEDDRSVQLMAPSGDGYEGAVFELDREYTEEEFHRAWHGPS